MSSFQMQSQLLFFIFKFLSSFEIYLCIMLTMVLTFMWKCLQKQINRREKTKKLIFLLIYVTRLGF
jgi:hypothetical protein